MNTAQAKCEPHKNARGGSRGASCSPGPVPAHTPSALLAVPRPDPYLPAGKLLGAPPEALGLPALKVVGAWGCSARPPPARPPQGPARAAATWILVHPG